MMEALKVQSMEEEDIRLTPNSLIRRTTYIFSLTGKREGCKVWPLFRVPVPDFSGLCSNGLAQHRLHPLER
jgi:hypothetical protein